MLIPIWICLSFDCCVDRAWNKRHLIYCLCKHNNGQNNGMFSASLLRSPMFLGARRGLLSDGHVCYSIKDISTESDYRGCEETKDKSRNESSGTLTRAVKTRHFDTSWTINISITQLTCVIYSIEQVFWGRVLPSKDAAECTHLTLDNNTQRILILSVSISS